MAFLTLSYFSGQGDAPGSNAGSDPADLEDFIDNDLGDDLGARGGAPSDPQAGPRPLGRGLGVLPRQGGGGLTRSQAESIATAAAVKAVAAAAGPAPQAHFQPCATPSGSGEGESGKPHFLALTQLGSIVSRPVDDHRTVEPTPPPTPSPPLRPFDSWAANGDWPFDSWAANGDWSVGLPAGEAVACVAVGSTFAAVATVGVAQQLRLFSLSGMQTAIISLAGPPVSLWPCPISPGGSTLSWLSFTDEGLLVTAASQSLVRDRTNESTTSAVALPSSKDPAQLVLGIHPVVALLYRGGPSR
eukprot:gene12074-15185_t